MQPLGPRWSEWAGLNARISADAGAEFPGRMICLKEMAFAYSESARLVRGALGAILRQRREASRRTLTEVAGEAGLSPRPPI